MRPFENGPAVGLFRDGETIMPHVETLGGRAAAEELVDHPEKAKTKGAEPAALPEVEIRSRRLEMSGEKTERSPMVPAFGHLSLASRSRAKKPSEFWSIHTPEMVPMFAEGPGAAQIADAGDNAEVGRKIRAMISGEMSKHPASDEEKPPSSSSEPPRNVVLFVGDGVGLDAVTAATYVDGPLAMQEMPVKGLGAVHGRSSLVPDDAAAATALATAEHVTNGALSLKASGDDSRQLRTVLEQAEKKGYRTGIVTTGELTNPTVAAMYAHREDGADGGGIAEDFVGLPSRIEGSDGIEVAFGGGVRHFDRSRRDSLKGRGVEIQTDWSGGGDAQRPVLRLLSEGAFPPASKRTDDAETSDLPTLRQMTRRAIERLEQYREPFFLVVEADGPGRLQRDMTRTKELVDAVVEYDRAVEAGVSFAEKNGETLVVATADADQTLSLFDNHYGFSDGVCGYATRCGGSYDLVELPVATGKLSANGGLTDSALQGEYSPPRVFLQYAWAIQAASERGEARGPNSANFVPVFAYGPWSGRLEGAIDQAEIGALIADWLK